MTTPTIEGCYRIRLFTVALQPNVDYSTRQTVSFEAMIRGRREEATHLVRRTLSGSGRVREAIHGRAPANGLAVRVAAAREGVVAP